MIRRILWSGFVLDLLGHPRCERCQHAHRSRAPHSVEGLDEPFSTTLCEQCWAELGTTQARAEIYRRVLLAHKSGYQRKELQGVAPAAGPRRVAVPMPGLCRDQIRKINEQLAMLEDLLESSDLATRV